MGLDTDIYINNPTREHQASHVPALWLDPLMFVHVRLFQSIMNMIPWFKWQTLFEISGEKLNMTSA
jgi:hypothetical protein